LLVLNLSNDVPCPELEPDLDDLYRWYDKRGRGNAPNRGKSCLDHWTGMEVHIRDDEERPAGLTDWIESVPYRVISRRFKALLQAAGAPCEFLPLSATYRGKAYPNEYFALNVLDVVREAIDFSASDMGKYDESVGLVTEGVSRLVLLPNLSDASMFFLHQILTVAVSDNLAEQINAENMLGCKCIAPSAFRR
jgi:hypothetical protein